MSDDLKMFNNALEKALSADNERLRDLNAKLVATLEAIDEHLIGFSSFDSTADMHHAVRAALAKAKG